MRRQLPTPAHIVVGAITLACTIGCGGRQQTDQADPNAVAPPTRADCCGDDWEMPPPEIGETPPDREAPPNALDAFEPISDPDEDQTAEDLDDSEEDEEDDD
mgnify:CR=1 FL=1